MKDTDYPNTAIVNMVFPYSKEIFLDLARKYMTLQRDPDAARDLLMLLVVGPLEQSRVDGDYTPFIVVQVFWNGIVNGPLTEGNGNYLKYIKPLLDITAPLNFVVAQVPLSIAAATLTTDYRQAPNSRYHVHSMSMPQFPDDSFIDMYANELEGRMHANSGVLYSSLQLQAYGGTGAGSQYNRNVGANAFPTRDTMLHIDDWLYFEDADEELVRDRVNNIREVTTKYWKVKGSADNSFMTTTTSLPSDAYNKEVKRWKDLEEYFPSKEWLNKLVGVKRIVDEDDLFHSVLTIPVSKKKRTKSKSKKESKKTKSKAR